MKPNRLPRKARRRSRLLDRCLDEMADTDNPYLRNSVFPPDFRLTSRALGNCATEIYGEKVPGDELGDVRCLEFALAYAQEYGSTLPNLERRDHLFGTGGAIALQQVGYEPTHQPVDGDLIAYGTAHRGSGQLNITHYGVVIGDRVLSKLGEGPVVEHRADAIPARYGDSYMFFHKDLVDAA